MDPISPDSLPGYLASPPGSAGILDLPEEKLDPKETVVLFPPTSMVCDLIPVLVDPSPPKGQKMSLKDVLVHLGRNKKSHNRKWKTCHVQDGP